MNKPKVPDSPSNEGDDDGYIYSAYITLRNGVRLYASACGKKAFRFKPKDKNRKDPESPDKPKS